ncbi:MAG: acyl-CoA desaturase [Bacteroidota bacterium]
MIHYKFSKDINKEFSDLLKVRVNEYFRTNKLQKKANFEMFCKSALALSLYLIPYFIILFAGITNVPTLFVLWILMGFGISFIGTSIMHDALHGAYSNNKLVNSIMGFSAALLGVDPTMWKIQHNVLHHTYTNIEDADEDIEPRFVLRFSPHQPKRWFHEFQHLYVWFFYSMSTVIWITAKDFVKLFKYREKGFVKAGSDFRKKLMFIAFRKASYFAFFLVLPIVMLDIPVGTTLLMFFTMHFVAGMSLSLIFQPAHVIETSNFIEQDEEWINENWSVHQILTTTNFAMKSKFIYWFSGGLNFQLEHHLFPNICHVHYPAISKILQKTTSEFNLPYHAKKTFLGAIYAHYKMLKDLGASSPVSVEKPVKLAA